MISSLFFKIRWRVLLVFWKIACILMPGKIFRFTIGDSLYFEYPLKSDIGQALFIKIFETAEIRFVYHHLQTGNIVFDVGANAGLFALIAAKKVGSTGHVYAFEPGLRELQLLRNNIAINHLNNITVVDCAVSDKVGTAQFAISVDGAMNSLAQTKHPSQKIQEWREVKLTTLDYFIEQQSIKKVDFIKIDVEGAEKKVLQGAIKLLGSSNAPEILCEFCDATATVFNSSGSDLWDTFVGLGFHLFRISNAKGTPYLLTPSPRKLSYGYENLVAQKPQ